MKCTLCGAENIDNSKFCQECGKELINGSNTRLNGKILKEHMIKRLGTDLRPSEEVKSFFGAGMLPSKKRQNASMFTTTISIKIKNGIKSDDIKSTAQIDEIIDNAYQEYKKISETKNKLKTEPTFKLILEPKKIVKTYTTSSDSKKLKRAGSVIGGGILLGPVGALAGYALSDSQEYETRTKIINKIHKEKHGIIQYDDNKFIFTNKKINWSIFYDTISSMHINQKYNKFEVYQIFGSKLTFIGEKNTTQEHTTNIFNDIKTRFKAYKLENESKEDKKQVQNNSEEQR